MKFKTSHLLIIFIVLLAVFFFAKNLNTKRNKGNMITEFFSFTLDDIIVFNIYPSFDENQMISIKKEKDGWILVLADGHQTAINEDHLSQSLNEFEKLKPSRLVTEDPKQHNQYLVDSTGTLLEIITIDQKKHQIILGDLTFQNNAYVNTYVRLPGEDAVYTSTAYMEGTFRSKPDQWRSKEIVNAPLEMWEEISITQTGKKSMTMSKKDGKWFSDDIEIEKEYIDTIVNLLTGLQDLAFAPLKLVPFLKSPVFTVNILFDKKGQITLNFYLHNNHYYLSSSINKGNYFIVEGDLYNNLFVEKDKTEISNN